MFHNFPSLSVKDDTSIPFFFLSSTDAAPIQAGEIDVLKVLHQHNARKADDCESIPQGGASALRRRPRKICEELCCVLVLFV